MVPVNDPTLDIRNHDRLLDSIEHASLESERFFGFLALGDIDNRAKHPIRLAAIIAFRFHPAINPSHHTVGTNDPVL